MRFGRVLKLVGMVVALAALVGVACGTTEVEVIKEVPVEVTKEVIKEVPVTKEVIKEVIKEVPVTKEVLVIATPTPAAAPVTEPAERVSEFVVAFGNYADRGGPPRHAGAGLQILQVYDPFLRVLFDEKGGKEGYAPQLIQEWEVLDGGKRIRVRLAAGAEGHQGWGEYTSEDVVWLVDFLKQHPQFGEVGAWESWDLKAEATGRYEAVFSRGDGKAIPLTQWLFGVESESAAVVKKYFESVGEEGNSAHPIGTGPFQFVSWGPGSMTLEAVTTPHWSGQRPVMDSLVYLQVPEAITRAALVITGKAHLGDNLAVEQASEGQKAGLNLVVYPQGLNVRYIFGDSQDFTGQFPKTDPWKDVNVRKAIALSIDKDAMADEFWGGFAKPLGAYYQTTAVTNPPYPYNIVEARRLLAEAGYPDGFDVEVPMITIGGAPRVPKEHEALVLSLQNLGLNVKASVLDWSVLSDLWRTPDGLKGNIFAFSWTVYPYAMRDWSWFRGEGGRNNWVDDQTLQLFADLEEARTTDAEQFARLEVEGLKYLYDNYATIPIYTTPELQLMAPEFKWKENMHFQRLQFEFLDYTP